MSHFDDVLGDVHGSFDLSNEDEFKFKIEAEPKKHMNVEIEHTKDGNTNVSYKFPENTWGIAGVDAFAWSGGIDNDSFTTKAEVETYCADGNKAELEVSHVWNPVENTHALNLEKKVST